MRAITVARKPLSEGSIAKNVLRWGTGVLNIGACRISTAGETIHAPQSDPSKRSQTVGTDLGITRASKEKMQQAQRESAERTTKLGRWPSNLILMHLPGCRHVGTAKVQGNRTDTRPEGDAGREDRSQWRFRPTEATRRGYSDDNGKEEIALWECEPGCPVAEMDRQSGPRQGCKPHRLKSNVTSYDGWGSITQQDRVFGYDDEGGASRFFKQVQSMGELIEYLRTLTTPKDGLALVAPSLSLGWAGYSDSYFHSAILQGTPTEAQAAEMLRVLRPGGHLMLIASDEQKTGHTGACRVEEAGFEIRDGIAVLDQGSRFHYVPKVKPGERNAGIFHLNVAEKNLHPTVKPVDLMIRLLGDVPPGEEVLDTFNGSGSTGIACIPTGHPYTGFEKEQEYVDSTDARLRYWAQEKFPTVAVEIESDANPLPPPRRAPPEVEALFAMIAEDE